MRAKGGCAHTNDRSRCGECETSMRRFGELVECRGQLRFVQRDVQVEEDVEVVGGSPTVARRGRSTGPPLPLHATVTRRGAARPKRPRTTCQRPHGDCKSTLRHTVINTTLTRLYICTTCRYVHEIPRMLAITSVRAVCTRVGATGSPAHRCHREKPQGTYLLVKTEAKCI